MINYRSNGKTKITYLTVGLVKKISLYKMSYNAIPIPINKIETQLDLSNHATHLT